jgi:hypothetical protein
MKNNLQSFLVAASLTASVAFAAVPTDTYDAGDILLGFYTASGTGATKNLMVNLGSYEQFDNNNGATVAFAPGLVADLVATYGSNWNTRTDITWAVTGTIGSSAISGMPRNTIFATSPRVNAGNSPVSIFSNTQSALGAVVTPVSAISNIFNVTDTTTNSSVTVVVDGGNPDSFFTRQGSNSGPQFNTSTNNDTNGLNISDFYGLVPTSPTNGTTAPSGAATDADGLVFARGTNYLGYFTLSSNGLNYTASGTAIPEPSSYAVLGGLVALGYSAIRRRRNTKA